MFKKLAALSLALSSLFVSANALSAEAWVSDFLKEQDRKLNLLYQEISSQLNAQDKENFKASQRAWLKFRDATVKAQGEDGDYALLKLTKERVIEFNDLLLSLNQNSQESFNYFEPVDQAYGGHLYLKPAENDLFVVNIQSYNAKATTCELEALCKEEANLFLCNLSDYEEGAFFILIPEGNRMYTGSSIYHDSFCGLNGMIPTSFYKTTPARSR